MKKKDMPELEMIPTIERVIHLNETQHTWTPWPNHADQCSCGMPVASVCRCGSSRPE